MLAYIGEYKAVSDTNLVKDKGMYVYEIIVNFNVVDIVTCMLVKRAHCLKYLNLVFDLPLSTYIE